MTGLPPTREQFYRHGPGPEVWEPLARRVATIDPSTNRILLPAHGCSGDDPLTLIPGEELDGEGDLPSGLSRFVTYYARVVSSSLLELAATPGGPAIDFGDGATVGMTIEFDVGPSIDQALANNASRFLACAAENGWIEPAGGWRGDVQDLVMDLAAWPLLDRRGYKPVGEGQGTQDGCYIRWKEARADLKLYCAGDKIPEGVILPAAEQNAPDTSAALGSSGWGDDDRGYGGRDGWADRRRPLV